METNHTWSGSYLATGRGSALLAYVVVGKVDGETLSYGSGDIEEWVSVDEGTSWKLKKREPVKHSVGIAIASRGNDAVQS